MIALLLIAGLAADRDACLQQFTDRAPRSAKTYFSLFDPLFISVGEKRGLDPALLKAHAWCETRFDPCAVSPVGARGLMQFMPRTFDLVASAAEATNPFDPIDSVESAGVYLSALVNYWQGDIYAVAASYNAGPGAVAKARARGRRVPRIPETEQYVVCVVDAFARFGGRSQVSPLESVFDAVTHWFRGAP